MTEEKKDEDFVGMLKKMKNEMDKPSVIGDALDKLEQLKKENAELKDQLQKSISLIRSSEQVLQRTLDEKERIKNENSSTAENLGLDIVNLKNENLSLTNKIQELENLLNGRNQQIQQKQNEIAQLKAGIEKVAIDLESKAQADSNADKNIHNLKEKIKYLEQQVEKLVEENASLNQQLIDQKNQLTVDYVVPINETSKPPAISNTTPESTSISTLETLCQDLQSDLNRYKRYIESLKSENQDLKNALEKSGGSADLELISSLKNENVVLKSKIIELQDKIKEKPQEVSISVESEKKISELQQQLKEKENIIANLKSSQITQPTPQGGPMTGLIDDLQGRINKLKIALSEKDKIIEELKTK